jgi:hypothetical protein
MQITGTIDLKLIVALITGLFSVLSYIRNEKFKKQAIAQLWSLFQKQQNGYEITQSVLAQYKALFRDNPNTDLLWTIARTEAFDQNIFEDIILQIVLTDDSLTNEHIDLYRQQNRISDYDVRLFKSILNKHKKTWIEKIIDKFKNIVGL